jgi:hypothetical protein
MDALLNLKVHFTKGEVLTITNATFEDAVIKMFDNMTFESQPLKVVFPSTKKVLYFDQNAFYAFHKKELTQLELLEKTQCEELCRSIIQLQSSSGDTIEPDTLFLKRNNSYIVADDDQYVELNLKNHSEIFKTI